MELIILFLISYITVREYLSFKERKDLYDRIMSGSIQEYKDNVTTEENELEDEDDKTIPIEDAVKEF